MSHAYPHHPQQHAPLPPLVPTAQLLDYVPADDQVYKRTCLVDFPTVRDGSELTSGRHFALKNLVHALEDENNMLALKLAQITTRCRDAEIARLRSLDESARTVNGANPSSSYLPNPRVTESRGQRSESTGTGTGADTPRDLATFARREEHESAAAAAVAAAASGSGVQAVERGMSSLSNHPAEAHPRGRGERGDEQQKSLTSTTSYRSAKEREQRTDEVVDAEFAERMGWEQGHKRPQESAGPTGGCVS